MQGRKKSEEMSDTHNVAVAGPGPLSFLSLPEVAHDVVEVLPDQFLHPLQSAESLTSQTF